MVALAVEKNVNNLSSGLDDLENVTNSAGMAKKYVMGACRARLKKPVIPADLACIK